MNLKTCVLALTAMSTPMVSQAQKELPYAKLRRMGFPAHSLNQPKPDKMVSFAEAQRVQGEIAKVMIKQKTPSLWMSPSLAKANLKTANKHYDEYGNVSKIYKDNKLISTISRTEDGKLKEYSDISYNAAKQKDLETIYMVDENDKIFKLADHKFNSDGTATVSQYNLDGDVVFRMKCKTRVEDGDLVPGDFIEELPIK